MSTPERIQLKRSKGWRMPDNTVKIDRTTRYGNPFEVSDGDAGWSISGPEFARSGLASKAEASAIAVEAYRKWAEAGNAPDFSALRGKNLACWCALDRACHGDVLLKLANR
jgi:hypothetical protein